MSAMVDTLSLLSSLHDEGRNESFIEPHYKEWYRVAIDALIDGGIASYQEFLAKERATEFLAEDELNYIANHIQKPVESVDNSEGVSTDDNSSSGTYWPMESDVEAPNLDLGWPYVTPGQIGATDINLYFHPPRGHPLTIKEMVRKNIKEARKVIAIVMDMFTDIDIFKELVEASTRGVPVYLLLDDVNLPHFMAMAEKQGFQVQRLRNMRVRTVKGQEYFSKSGAKFCGKMEQKFLLVDCEKVMYGTYSFMWSYEKVHLSMIQVITGKLVECFDEEFRTLYARSSIPAAFGPEVSVTGKCKKIAWENGSHRNSLSSLLSASSLRSQRSIFGRKEQISILDSSYLKSRNRFVNNEEERYNRRNLIYRGFNVQNKGNQFQQFDRNDNWKRHSYAAGEKTDLSPYLMLNRATNSRINHQPVHWNRHPDVTSIGSSSRGGYSSHYNGSTTQSFASRLSHRLTTNLSERNSTVRRSFHGTDNHVRSVQQRMPTLEHTTKSFLRNWRIESYLNDHSDIPPESSETELNRGDGNEGVDNSIDNSLHGHPRLRPSILYKPTLPEQKEASSCTTNSSHSNSTIVDSQGSLTPKASSPIHVRDSEPKEIKHIPSHDTPQSSNQQDVLKRRSLQVPDNSQITNQGLSYNTNPGPSSYLYATISTNKQPDSIKKQNENILKRRSLPLFESRKVNLGHSNNVIPPNYIYTSLVKRQQENPLRPTDVHNTDKLGKNVSNQNEPIGSDTVQPVKQSLSTETLDEDDSKDSPGKKENKGSPSFLKKGSKKLKSLLNLAPDKKETLSKNKAPAFYRMCSSSDTLISEDDDEQCPKISDSKNDSSPQKEKTLSVSQISLNKSKENVTLGSSSSNILLSESPTMRSVENKFLDNTGNASAPRFNTEQIQFQDTRTQVKSNTYGRVVTPAMQREIALRQPKQGIQRVLSQREMHHSTIPHIMHREMHLRHSHRDMQHKELPRRDMNMVQQMPDFTKPQEDSSTSRLNDRRVYSRFDHFSNTPSINAQVLDYKSKGVMPNYSRPPQTLSYNSNVYNSVQPNENKFGRFMQKFGNFIHKKQ